MEANATATTIAPMKVTASPSTSGITGAIWEATPGTCPKCKKHYDDTMGFDYIRYNRKKTAVCRACVIEDWKFREAKRSARKTKIKIIERPVKGRR